jgi:thioredoxin reductase
VKTHDLIIIGAGPAGLSAAAQADAMGITPMVIDEGHSIGGRIYAQSGLMQDDSSLESSRKIKQLNKTIRPSKNIIPQTQVIGIFPDNILLITGKSGTVKIRYRSLIIAVGARELSIPFPGWTLPGVMTSGCAQALIKTQGIFPEQAVLAGTGPLQLVLAAQILKRGGKVPALVETGSLKAWLIASKALLGHWRPAMEMTSCLFTLAKHRVPIYFNSLISAAKGNNFLQKIDISSINGKFKKTIKTDTLCMGYGFVPSHELSSAAGAKQEFRHGRWVPVRGPDMQTTVKGVFAVGDGAQINGAAMAIYEGALAAIGAAKYLGRILGRKAEKRQQDFYKKIRKEETLRKQFNQIIKLPDKVFNLACDDTIICRCEDISLKKLKKAVKNAGPDINEVKRLSRAGMGLCQGRTCCTSVMAIVSKSTGENPEKLGFLTPRPPFKPVTLGQLANNNLDQEKRNENIKT